MHSYKVKHNFELTLEQGDITHPKTVTEAIANAANRHLVCGGGVDGAIHKAAGPGLQIWLNALSANKLTRGELLKDGREAIYGKELSAGNAVLTPSFNLALSGVKYIIHCVGPIYKFSKNPAQELESCYKSALELCKANNIKSIAFPSISTGIYGYPLEEATKIAIDTVIQNAEKCGLEYCKFVLFDIDTYNAFLNYTVTV